MPPFNPGYDIISRAPNGGTLRYIEVKSVSSDWGELGVGLTRTEFGKAREEAALYWLCIVERALDDDAKIHYIQDPANKVDEFLYDVGWQAVVEQDIRRLYPPENY